MGQCKTLVYKKFLCGILLIFLGDVCLTPTCVKLSANMLTSMDSTVDPCQDFYQYACGGWIRENPIPEGKSSWGTFQKLWQQNQLVIKIALGNKKNKVKADKF